MEEIVETPKLGRPPVYEGIDVAQLRQCAEKLWTYEEIGAHFRVSGKTIQRHFGDEIEICRQLGKTKLRDLQWRNALKGDTKMIIHMAKHQLKEHDRIDQRVITTEIVAPSEALGSLLKEIDPLEKEHDTWK